MTAGDNFSQSLPRRKNEWLASVWLLCCFALGGASAAGVYANLLLQILAAALIAVWLWRGASMPVARAERWLAWMFGLLVGWILLTLIPLPPSFWSTLPGREGVAHGYRLMDMRLPWLPITLSDDRTVRSALSLLVPLATFLIALRQSKRGTGLLLAALTSFAIVSVGLGMAQMIGGTQSPLRLYAITNRDSPVGLFANANHFAILLVATIPLMAAWLRNSLMDGKRDRLGIFLYFLFLTILAIGIVMAQSLAGIGLAVPAVAGSLVILFHRSGNPRHRSWLTGVGLLSVALAVMALVANSARFDSKFNDSPTSRAVATPITLEAARDFIPAGSGLGSFVQIYASYEPDEYVSNTWMNHAHNDLAEVVLELGIPGALLIAGFLVWLAWMSWRAWITELPANPVARGAMLSAWLICAHSLVDYPLRSAAIAALFALCLAATIRRDPVRPANGDQK